MSFEPSPIVIVTRHGDSSRSIERLRALRPDDRAAVVEFDPSNQDVSVLVEPLQRFAADTSVEIVFLLGDLDNETVDAQALVEEAVQLSESLKQRLTVVRTRVWFVVRSGPQVGSSELDLVRLTEERAKDMPFSATLFVTSSSGAALEHRSEHVDRQLGDLLHLITVSRLVDVTEATSRRSWAVGIGSALYRPDGLVNALVRSIDDSLEHLVDGSLRDPAYQRGTRWVADLNLAPPEPGAERDDSEGRALLAGPGRGSLADDPARELRRVAAQLDSLNPGLWAGMIAAEIDVVTAPRTDPDDPDRSPLVVATDQVRANLEKRRTELEQDIVAEAHRILDEQRSLPSCDAWCEGARAAIQDAIDRLEDAEPPEPRELAKSYSRLARAARVLPYSSSMLMRAILIIVIAVIVGYVYAPVGTFVAWAFSKRVFWFGDTLEENARIWARVTAAGIGGALWLWWEALWRRIRRFSQQYVSEAEAQIRQMVEESARKGRIQLLADLRDVLGTPTGPPASLRSWLGTATAALAAIRQDAADDARAGSALMEDDWAVVIPSVSDPSRVFSDLEDARRDSLKRRPIDAVLECPRTCTVDEAVNLIRAAIESELPDSQRNLQGHWPKVDAIGEGAKSALSAKLWSGLPAELTAIQGVTPKCYLVASEGVAAVVKQVREFDGVIGCGDPNFVANLWLTPVTPPELAEGEGK